MEVHNQTPRHRTPPSSELSPPLTPRHSPIAKSLSLDVSSLADSVVPTLLTPPIDTIPSDNNVVDNYVAHTLASTKPLAPVGWHNWWKELNYLSTAVLTITPCLAIYGAFTTKLRWETALFSVFWYYVTALAITAGYHRLWAHRSYSASPVLEYALALAGAGAVQGSIKWWSRGHRAHHRYTDTDLDPYSAHRGLLWSHIGWMIVKARRKPGVADVSDLSRNEIVRFQHQYYVWLLLLMAFVLPTVITGLGWGDWRGGYFYAGAMRLCFVHHSTFCVNSLAHYLGTAPFDDKHTPRNHVITALVTVGEGYHNFHHQFPMDYRNAIRWYQYDPTKWFITVCFWLGLATQLKTFPDCEIRKGVLTMELKTLEKESQAMQWPKSSNDLPVISWESFQEQSLTRPLVLVSGFIHDVSSFLDEHPGGRHLLAKYIGRDATTAFWGGVYDHSNAAHNLLAMMRVGALHGGLELESERAVPPSQRLQVVRAVQIAELIHQASHDGPDNVAFPSPASNRLGVKGVTDL